MTHIIEVIEGTTQEIEMYTTANGVVKVNGEVSEGFGSVYFGVSGDSVEMSFYIVNDEGQVQSQLDSEALGYPPVLALPVLKIAGGSNLNVVDEIYFQTELVEGVITATGSFPSSGNWKIISERVNAALAEIGADWGINKDDVTFRVGS